jgi:hypothetical protein
MVDSPCLGASCIDAAASNDCSALVVGALSTLESVIVILQAAPTTFRRSGFPPTARIDTRLTVVDWPLVADDELDAAVLGVTAFELANAAPAVVEDGTNRHLAWRGYLTGGLLTLYERLGTLLSERGLGAFYADPRLEVFVPADGEVVVLGALRHPIRIERTGWDARVAAADGGNDLAEGSSMTRWLARMT